MIGHFKTFARYNAWANGRLFAACGALSDEDYFKDRKAFFGSIHGTLNHGLLGDRVWMARLEDTDHNITGYNDSQGRTLFELIKVREKEDARIIAFIDGLNENRLGVVYAYINLAGEEHKTSCHHILTHMFNHATHHRGQVHAMLSQTREPPSLDLIYFLRVTK